MTSSHPPFRAPATLISTIAVALAFSMAGPAATSADTVEARQEVTDLTEQIEETKASLRQTKRALNQPELAAAQHDTLIDSLQAQTARLTFLQRELDGLIDDDDGLSKGAPFIILVVFVLSLLALAVIWQSWLLRQATDRDTIIKELLDNTFSLPAGTVRGILALVVAVTFLGLICSDVPEEIKVLASLVFGFYFAKSRDSAKALMNAMTGGGGRGLPGLGSPSSGGPAGPTFPEMVSQARVELAELRLDGVDEEDILPLADAIGQAGTLAASGDTAGALSKLSEANGVIKTMRRDEVGGQYLSDQLTPDQRQTLKDARTELSSETLNVTGDKTLEELLALTLRLREDAPELVALFKKRVLGKVIEGKDLDIGFALGDLEPAQLLDLLELPVRDALKGFSGLLPSDAVPQSLLRPENLKILVRGNRDQVNALAEQLPDSKVDLERFFDFAWKVRKNLVDTRLTRLVGDIVEEGIGFERYCDLMKELQAKEASQRKGTVAKVLDIFNNQVVQSALALTPAGSLVGPAKRGIKIARKGRKLLRGLTRLL